MNLIIKDIEKALLKKMKLSQASSIVPREASGFEITKIPITRYEAN